MNASDRIRQILALPPKPQQQSLKSPPPVVVGYNAASGQLQFQGGNGAISEGRLKTSGAVGLGDPVLGIGGVTIAKPHVRRVTSGSRVYPITPQRIKVLFAVPKTDTNFVDLYIGGHSAPILIEENYPRSLLSVSRLSNTGLEADDWILTTMGQNSSLELRSRVRSKGIDRFIEPVGDFSEFGIVDQGYGNSTVVESTGFGFGSFPILIGSYSHLRDPAIVAHPDGTYFSQDFNNAAVGDLIESTSYELRHQYLSSSLTLSRTREKISATESRSNGGFVDFLYYGQTNQAIASEITTTADVSQTDTISFVENGVKTQIFQYSRPIGSTPTSQEFLLALLQGDFSYYDELEIPDYSVWGKRATNLLENQKAYSFVNTEPYAYELTGSSVDSYSLSDIFANGGEVDWLLVGVSPTNFAQRTEFTTPIFPLGNWPPFTEVLSISLFNEDVT